MGIADFKHRMRDVPGIESLTMTMQGGQQIYAFAGREVTFDAAAPDSQVEAGIRAAVASPALVQMAAGGPIDAAAAAVALHPSISASLLPQVKAMADTPAAHAAPSPTDAAHTVKGMLEQHVKLMGDIHAAQVALLDTALQRQRQTVSTAVGNVATKINSQTDDFMSIMGQFTNSLEGL